MLDQVASVKSKIKVRPSRWIRMLLLTAERRKMQAARLAWRAFGGPGE